MWVFSNFHRKVVRQSIINPDWDFGKMGIGGLDKEFNAVFRRAFASRVFPPELVEQLGTPLEIAQYIKKNLIFKLYLMNRMQARQRYSSVWSTWYR